MEKPEKEEPQCSHRPENETVQTEQGKRIHSKRYDIYLIFEHTFILICDTSDNTVKIKAAHHKNRSSSLMLYFFVQVASWWIVLAGLNSQFFLQEVFFTKSNFSEECWINESTNSFQIRQKVCFSYKSYIIFNIILENFFKLYFSLFESILLGTCAKFLIFSLQM